MQKRLLGKLGLLSSNKLIVVFTLTLVTYSCGDTSSLSPLASDATILAFGDSLTHGTGANKGQDYPSILADLSNITVINEGIPGEISNEGLVRLPTLLDKYNPDLLILIHGGNDIIRKLSRTKMKQNLLTMIAETQRRNIEIIMLAVPEANIFLSSADEYREIADETDIPIEFSLLAKVLNDNSLKSDAVHPNAKGYQLLATGIFDFLKQQGAIIE